jgi:hypothetical protein
MINKIPAIILGFVFGAIGSYIAGFLGWLIFMGTLISILLLDFVLDEGHAK